MDKRVKHFVLVHGGCHGAWCWYKVATELRAAGHRVTALDMAASGVHPKQVDELRSMSDYVQPLMEFMESLPSDDWVVLVGHSAGGVSIFVAMERYPNKINEAVFVTAIMIGPDLSLPAILQQFLQEFESWMDCQHQFHQGLDKPPTSILFGPKYLESELYNLSPPEDLTLATSLVRPHPVFQDEPKLLKDTALTKENYGSVRRVYVLIEEDKVVKESLQRWMIENNPTDEVRVIPGSDHMVMFSKPKELIKCLLGLAS
ncbi:methyl jasmonate esterase 1-like [Rhododendron vialii]|uniref:methyl jasmonate esterase 1-like n=1 Tax=Rhododendron vialii TaxID=182163 RepID=UPI00265DAB7D|nr:methyl jasmonate esterase 1-like [Rhododendron vialii]